MTPEDRIALEKRRRQRNWAMLAVLLGLVMLFYLVTIAKRG